MGSYSFMMFELFDLLNHGQNVSFIIIMFIFTTLYQSQK